MRVLVQFTEFGEPCGEGSVKLSSYLGPLVREHVPIVIDDWRKIGEELKTVLWESVKKRFELEGEYEKVVVMKQMGCLWRASKSRLVKKIRKAQNNIERMKLQPDNISTAEWRKFVKENTSQEFKAANDSYKERRRKQIPHTCSRRGMVRLAEDLRQFSEVREHLVPRSVNQKPQPKCIMFSWYGPKFKVAEGRILSSDHMDLVNNALLGPNSVKVLVETAIEGDIFLWRPTPNMFSIGESVGETIVWPQDCVDAIEHELESEGLTEAPATTSPRTQSQLHTPTAPMKSSKPLSQSSSGFSQHSSQQDTFPKQIVKEDQKCRLLDITGQKRVIAEGRWSSNSPEQLVHSVPLGHNAVRVWIDVVKVPDAKVWRPNYEIECMEDAIGTTLAWPEDKVVII